MADVEVVNGEDKIMTATSSEQDLQVSISFGKFENDSLSWDKFSSFSPNKYLEEVKKCATPGTVARKKAYFESHYKNIAERKTEIILEQEKQLERDPSFSFVSVQNHGNTDIENNHVSVMINSNECYGPNGMSTSEEDKFETSIATQVNETCIDELLVETTNSEECQSAVNVGDDLNSMKLEKLNDLNILKLEKVEKIVLMEEKSEFIVQVKPEEIMFTEEEGKEETREDILSKDTCEMSETPMKETKKEEDENPIKNTYKVVRINHIRGSPKPNQMTKKSITSKIVASGESQPSKEKSMIKATNKAASPISKAPGLSTPRVSKPASTISPRYTSRPSVKKEHVATLPRKKQTASKTLHNSLNLAQPSSGLTALATTKRSLIMEQMGDKEIIRRVFKSFDQVKPFSDGQETAPKQVPAKATSVSRLATTGQKENGRLRKSDGLEKKGSSSYRSSSIISKSNRTAENQELSRPEARSVNKIRLPAKPKAERNQCQNSKADS